MAKKGATTVAPAAPRALSSFADLLRERGVAVATDTPQGRARETAVGAAQPVADLSRGAKVVLRRERKGHGGKTVTVVDGLPLAAAELDGVARQLRKALGCGARVDAGRVVVQGDLVDAVERWLRTHGVRQVVRGN